MNLLAPPNLLAPMNLLVPIIVAARWMWVITAILVAIPIGAVAVALTGLGNCLVGFCRWLLDDRPWLTRARPKRTGKPLVVTGPGGEYRRPLFPAPPG